MIIFLNGSINSGKSTIANLLSQKLEKIAVVEIDVLRSFVPNVSIEESIPLNLENAILVIRNFVKHKYNVVVPYPLSQNNYEFILNELSGVNEKIMFFTLAPSLVKAQSDTETRKLTDWERERIKYHYDIGINDPGFGKIIDTTDQSPDETTAYIISRVDSKIV